MPNKKRHLDICRDVGFHAASHARVPEIAGQSLLSHTYNYSYYSTWYLVPGTCTACTKTRTSLLFCSIKNGGSLFPHLRSSGVQEVDPVFAFFPLHLLLLPPTKSRCVVIEHTHTKQDKKHQKNKHAIRSTSALFRGECNAA